MRRIVEFTYNYYIEPRGLRAPGGAENQARGRHLKKSKAMRTLNRPIIDRLARVIERGQAEGSFRTDVDPVEMHMAIAALGMFNITNQYTFGRHLPARHGREGRRRPPVAKMVDRHDSQLPDRRSRRT